MPRKSVIKNLPRGVFEHPKGSGICWIQHYDANSKRRREKAGTLANANKLLAIRRAEKLMGKLPPIAVKKEKLLFKELVADALVYARSENEARTAHQLDLKFKILLPEFGRKEVETISRKELVAWLDEQEQERDWLPATYNRWKAALSLVFRVGNLNEKTERNPLRGVRNKHEDNSRCRYLKMDEEKALSAILQKSTHMDSFLLSLHTGMRASEQKRSVVGDYSPGSGMLTVHQKKDRNKPKVRYVPLTPIAVEAYHRLAAGKKPGELLCVNSRNNALNHRHWFEEAVAEAKIDDYHWHDNRHTACSRWVMRGVPLAEVSKYAGHSTIQMTMRYSHLIPDASRANDKMMSFYPEWAVEAGARKAPQSEVITATETATSLTVDLGLS